MCEKEGWRERVFILKEMTGALAPFSYLVYKIGQSSFREIFMFSPSYETHLGPFIVKLFTAVIFLQCFKLARFSSNIRK